MKSNMYNYYTSKKLKLKKYDKELNGRSTDLSDLEGPICWFIVLVWALLLLAFNSGVFK